MLASRAADWTLVFQLQSSLMAAYEGFGRLMELGFLGWTESKTPLYVGAES